MKRDTRQDILNTAQTLFREKGYNAVSVGEIAAALGISKGNLTYYFKRKEEIVEALLESANPTFPQDPPQTLAQLDACLRDMEQARENNAFYFRSHTQLGQLSEKIRAKGICDAGLLHSFDELMPGRLDVAHKTIAFGSLYFVGEIEKYFQDVTKITKNLQIY